MIIKNKFRTDFTLIIEKNNDYWKIRKYLFYNNNYISKKIVKIKNIFFNPQNFSK